MAKLNEIISDRKKSILIVPSIINFKLIDYFLFIPYDRLKAFPSNNNATTLELTFEKYSDYLFIFQVKKDFEYVCEKYDDIVKEWEKTKTEIKKMIKHITLVFIIVTNNKSVDSGAQVLFRKDPMEDIWFCFADTINEHYFYKN